MFGKKTLFAVATVCALAVAAATPSTAQAHHGCCQVQVAECCCPAPPPPVSVSWCVVDPCDPCCKYTVSACLPACCICQTPCLAGWKKGLFGRKILTYKFPCGECVEVVLTRRGARVR